MDMKMSQGRQKRLRYDSVSGCAPTYNAIHLKIYVNYMTMFYLSQYYQLLCLCGRVTFKTFGTYAS